MTLAKGNHVMKLDLEGKPLTTDKESYIEFEVEELTPHFQHMKAHYDPEQKVGTETDETYVVALLRKVR